VHDQLVRVRRAVVANVGAEQLYGRLVSADDLPSSIHTQMRAFRRAPATVKIDYALSGQVPWAEEPPYAPGTVHIADSYEELTTFYGQLNAGAIPDRPF